MLVNFSMYNRTLGMIFELCEGGQLNKLLHNPDNSPTRRFNTGRKMAMAKDVAIGLEYIHSMRSLCVCVCVCVWCLRQFLYLMYQRHMQTSFRGFRRAPLGLPLAGAMHLFFKIRKSAPAIWRTFLVAKFVGTEQRHSPCKYRKVHRSRFTLLYIVIIGNSYQICTQKQNGNALHLFPAAMLKRWLQVCRVKITFELLPTN